MKPEDLGIAPFSPEPVAAPDLIRKADAVALSVRTLTATAQAILRENLALRGALERERGTRRQIQAANGLLRREARELRTHRTVLFILGLILLLLR
jgi:hypothetical protein